MQKILGIILTLFLLGPIAQGETYNMKRLIRESLELGHLALLEENPGQVRLYSSYDRRSTNPERAEWFFNSDGFGQEPIPNFEDVLQEPNEEGIGEYLICEAQGPGAIVRLWTAAINGEIILYLDDMEKPFYEGPAEPFLKDCLAAMTQSQEATPGWRQYDASYLPLPFSRQMRMVWRGNIDIVHFYHVEVRTWPESVEMEGIQREAFIEKADWFREKGRELVEKGGQAPPELTEERTLVPGGIIDLFRVNGEGRITEMALKLDAPDMRKALRETVLTVHFDGSERPQVDAPVGDFFGSWPGIVPYETLPMTVHSDGTMVCRLPMPYQSNAVMRLLHYGEQTVQVAATLTTDSLAWNEDRSLYFHGKWANNRELRLNSLYRFQDLPVLMARGKGHFIGMHAFILNPTPYVTFGGSWWGEGDEKIFVDDESHPVFFGTGTEDYFNYSWSMNTIFQHPFCAQPMSSGPGSRGYIVNSRWHTPAPVPFQKRIDFFLEIMHHVPLMGIDYGYTAFYYARPGAVDNYVGVSPAALAPEAQLPGDWSPRGGQGLELRSAFFQAEEVVQSDPQNVATQTDQDWSGSKILRWTPEEEKETLSFTLPVSRPGNWRVGLVLGHSPRGGQVVVEDGEGNRLHPDPIDTYHPFGRLYRAVHFDARELGRGDFTIQLRVVGAHPESAGRECLVDFFWCLEERPSRPVAGFEVLEVGPGVVYPQHMTVLSEYGQWTNSDQLMWVNNEGAGAVLKLAFYVPYSGDYALKGIFTKAEDYGKIRITLNDKVIQDELDLYQKPLKRTEPIFLGRQQLEEGTQVLTIEVIGRNPKSSNSFVGIDDIFFEPLSTEQ